MRVCVVCARSSRGSAARAELYFYNVRGKSAAGWLAGKDWEITNEGLVAFKKIASRIEIASTCVVGSLTALGCSKRYPILYPHSPGQARATPRARFRRLHRDGIMKRPTTKSIVTGGSYGSIDTRISAAVTG